MANILIKRLLIMAVLLVPASVFTGTVLFFTGWRFTEAILPVTNRIITFLHPEYQFKNFQLSKQARPREITFFAFVPNPGSGVFFNNTEGVPFSRKILESNIYIMPLITFSLLFAWPFLGLSQKLGAILISFPLLLLAEVFDLSLFIIGNIEAQLLSNVFIPFTDTSVAASNTPSVHISTLCISFLDTGGRQFIAILIFLLAIAPFHLKARALPLRGTVRGNDPCTCGSGKKFKKCCGR